MIGIDDCACGTTTGTPDYRNWKVPHRQAVAGSSARDRPSLSRLTSSLKRSPGTVAGDMARPHNSSAARGTGRVSLAFMTMPLRFSLMRAQIHAPDRSENRATISIRSAHLSAERLQYEGYLRREETNAPSRLCRRRSADQADRAQTGYSRKLVRQVIRGERHDVSRTAEFARSVPVMALRSAGRRLPNWRISLAPPQGTGLPGLSSCRWRMDNSSTAVEG